MIRGYLINMQCTTGALVDIRLLERNVCSTYFSILVFKAFDTVDHRQSHS